MSIFEENSQDQAFILFQQNIQEIALFMFNLFAQNVQIQAQTQIKIETMNEAVFTTFKKFSFRASDVEFFDFQLDFSYDSSDVVQVDRDLYYKNVYLFVKRVKNVVIMSDVDVVTRRNGVG
jgi:hypothetical protein